MDDVQENIEGKKQKVLMVFDITAYMPSSKKPNPIAT